MEYVHSFLIILSAALAAISIGILYKAFEFFRAYRRYRNTKLLRKGWETS